MHSNIKASTSTFRVLTNNAEKRKWLQRFYAAYDGGIHPITTHVFGPSHKHLVLNIDGSEVGYLCIHMFDQETLNFYGWKEAWVAELGYVKPKYRSRGYQRMLLQHAIDFHHCKAVNLLEERLLKANEYFFDLGFKHSFCFGSTLLTVINDELFNAAIATQGLPKVFAPLTKAGDTLRMLKAHNSNDIQAQNSNYPIARGQSANEA